VGVAAEAEVRCEQEVADLLIVVGQQSRRASEGAPLCFFSFEAENVAEIDQGVAAHGERELGLA
jgi:hypothetical protein